jgi:hypothetical protein
MRTVLGRLPLKPPKPRLTLRIHGGTTATQATDGGLLPTLKRKRIQGPAQRGPSPTRADPTSVTEWPPSPPLLLSEAQSENLGTYIDRDTKRLGEIGFAKLVSERRKRSDFSPGVRKLRHKAARLLDHLQGCSPSRPSPQTRSQRNADDTTMERPTEERNHGPRPP